MDKKGKIEHTWEEVLRERLEDADVSFLQPEPLEIPKRSGWVAPLIWCGAVAATLLLLFYISFRDRTHSEDLISSSEDYNNSYAENRYTKSAESSEVINVKEGKTQKMPKNKGKELPVTTDDQKSAEQSSEEESSSVTPLPSSEVEEKRESKSDKNTTNSSNPYPQAFDDLSRTAGGKAIERKRLPLQLIVSGGATMGSELNLHAGSANGLYLDNASLHLRKRPIINLLIKLRYPLSSDLFLQGGLGYSWCHYEYDLNIATDTSNTRIDVKAIALPIEIYYSLYTSQYWSIGISTGLGFRYPVSSLLYNPNEHQLKLSPALEAIGNISAEYQIDSKWSISTSVGGTYDIVSYQSKLYTELSFPKAGLNFSLGVVHSL